MATNRVYAATALSGGAEGALDTIFGTGLIQGDMAFVIDNTSMYIFGLNASSGAAESSPDVIKPDTDAGTKRWILQSLIVNDVTVRDDVILVTDDLTVGGELINTGGSLKVGVTDDTRGQVYIYGNDGDLGAILKMFVGDDHDVTTNLYQITAFEDDWWFGGGNDLDMLKFIAETSIQATVPLDVDAALTATTVDADTDFTVGGTVITDGDITDNGQLVFTLTTGARFNGGGNIQFRGTAPLIEIAQSAGGAEGNLYVYGGTGDTAGGSIRLYADDTQDGNGTDSYRMQVIEDDLYIGPDNDTNIFQILGGAIPTAQFNAAVDIDAALTANTIDTAAQNEWTKPQNVDEQTLSSNGNAVAWDAALVQCGYHNLTENTTVSAPSNLKAGGTYILRVEGDGASSLAFNAVFKWGTADTPIAPAADGDIVIFSFYSDGTNMYGVDAVREEA